MYIRTKDDVYELVDNLYQYHNGVEKFWYAKEENGTTLAIEITADKILNQSENLEELCDQIVSSGRLYQVTLLNDCLIEDSFEELREPITDEMIKDGIYGAIWTNKGLIYVAKMNENGELELI